MWQDRCIKTFLISIISIILIGTFKSQISNPLSQQELQEERYWALKTFAKPKFDMVILGDSRAFCGVSPNAMNMILPNYRILNFGYSQGGLNPIMYHEGETKLDPRSPKKTILLAVTPSSLLSETEKNLAFQEKKSMSKEYVYLLIHFYPIVSFFSPIKAENFIPYEIKTYIRRLFNKDDEGIKYREYHDNGWMASWDVPENPKRYLGPFRRTFIENQISEQLVQELIDQTRKWITQNIQVFGFRPPTTREMEALENEFSGFNEDEFSEKFETAGGIWFSFPVERYHSFDASHLHKNSAVQFSKDLAIQIKKHLANSY